MATALRRTGIEILGRVPWGTHICLFYETEQDLMDTVAPHFTAGLQDNELCIWAISDLINEEHARAALAREIPNFDRHSAAGCIEIVSNREWFVPGNGNDPQRIISAFRDKLHGAFAKGLDGMRLTVNAYWFGTPHRDEFLAFERELDQWLTGNSVLGLCTYPLQASNGRDVLDVAGSRDITIARRQGRLEVIETFPLNRLAAPLTQRELEVLTWVARGKTAWEIAGILSISKRTVDEHARQAALKLGAANRAQAVAIAIRNRLVDPMSS